MKRTISIISILLVALLLCTSCKKEVHNLKSYKVLLYGNSVGAEGDNVTPRYKGDDIYKNKRTTKSNVKDKKIKLFGNDLELKYDCTREKSYYQKKYDYYDTSFSGKDFTVVFSEDTGKIVKYDNPVRSTDHNFISDVNSRSTEEEFLAYAKKMILDISGVSVEGRQFRMSTLVKNSDGTAKYHDGYVNNSDTDPDFFAYYSYGFYSTLGGIEREDLIGIGFSNFGAVYYLSAFNNDAICAKFADVQIDKEKLIESVRSEFLKNVHYDMSSYNIDLKVVPYKNDLFVKASVDYSLGSGEDVDYGGVRYLIKVAELK